MSDSSSVSERHSDSDEPNDEWPDHPHDDELRALYSKAVAKVRSDRSKKRRIRELVSEDDDDYHHYANKAVRVAPPAAAAAAALADDDVAVIEAKKFLGDCKLSIIDWTDDVSYKPPVGSSVRSGPKKQLFPHKVRMDAKLQLQVFVETAREVRVYAHITSKKTGQRIKDDDLLLKHANALLPAGVPPRMGIALECFVVHSDRDDEKTAIPQACGPNNQFALEIADRNAHGTLETALFIDQQSGIHGRLAELKCGVVLAENIKIKKEALTSNLLTYGKFRFALRPLHPVLAKLAAMTARSQPFVTSARVRGLA